MDEVVFRKVDGSFIIKNIGLKDDQLIIDVSGGLKFVLRDDGQDCCEERFLHTDDDLATAIGEELVEITQTNWTPSAPNPPKDFDPDSVVENTFLTVKTNRRTLVVCAYNNHNGYYGGFHMVMEVVSA